MSEKRNPEIKIIAEKSGKRLRIELFRSTLWPKLFPTAANGMCTKRYRIRGHGKWVHGDHSFTITHVMKELRSRLK